MRIITLNLNGIRSATRKGMFQWLAQQNADVICFQELKAQAHQLEDPVFQLDGYTRYFNCAEKKGYSGVGIYTRHAPQTVISNHQCETTRQEGRYVAVQLGNLWIASLYLPSGTSGEERQKIKYAFLDEFALYLKDIIQTDQHYIICGDWNIAHKEIDLKNWRSNRKHSGFLPEERAWLDVLFNQVGFVDAFRVVNQEAEQYTWWSNRGRAYEKNVGWRIDYQIISPGLKNAVKSAAIYKEQRFSDHAPLIMEYDVTLALPSHQQEV